MEAIVLEDSPLADYLEGEGADTSPKISNQGHNSSKLSSPSFAPRGQPKPRPKFRQKLPPHLRLSIPHNKAVHIIHNTCSKAVNSRLGRADNARFLERFRYIIVASQLLSAHSQLGFAAHARTKDVSLPSPSVPQLSNLTITGAILTASSSFALAWLVHWARGDRNSPIGVGRVFVLCGIFICLAVISYSYFRRQWLQYLRQQNLKEVSAFVAKAQDFDSAVSASLSLVQEVELVSRGYRISTPLPPVSRLDDRSQIRRCARLRKQLRLCFADVIPRYTQAYANIKPFTQQMDLEKYYDIYDISDADFSEAMLGYKEAEFEDNESLRVLKILAARFYMSRKIMLCCLMALDAHGGKSDFLRWSMASDEINAITNSTSEAEECLHRILSEEENFPVPSTPKIPLTPNRERWRSQLRKLNSLSSGIRGLQAKLHVLREESDKNLNETEDVSEFGTTLMMQYESIGIDLKALMQEWEDGKNALAINIDRNERRLSSMSGMLSPAISLGGLTAVEEGGALDALKALNGESPSRSSMDLSPSDAEEVFEAVALPRQRQRSTLTREERIAKMKEDRVRRESTQDKAEANTRMLRELESVINLRPRGRTQPSGRITSL
ncbi:Mysoin-binding motif of peroxisomes-domain-containing protein [Amylocarpus encephaloides]|uniref:Vezatin n=1 Tax=Amylocarpus encephaloides TaxID=45428 RepID=A0A9P7YRZ8_9HELO|nr:Mysoin-binding motif of peroxisomes-domain-containing protein [Amylocarpus encephaloides]